MDVDVDKGIWWQIYISERKGKKPYFKTREERERKKNVTMGWL